ncbi:succinyldiaminopimelate transaminase [Helicobacter bilis]|uniref:Succinyldiaminopimelate transaminase n=1 Tax=Helicobacter bilis TaxID=37372 RepID=A0A4U8UA76_9HELI|nr:succinyldiaminopimelate transaminase [Helicobacter bilis]TLE07804.1 succinyldiaminopimelate transaminase [Helicobacter bilis]TLE09527.1 succinyldiaminopimelate transaminase [Helicobacter bilis]
MTFNPYPFEKLRALLETCDPNANKTESCKLHSSSGLNLSIGEPAFPSPTKVVQALCDNASLIRYYPTLDSKLPEVQREFFYKRFNIALKEDELIPTFGSREVLFNFTHFIFTSTICKKQNKPTLAFPNPFYQIYEGAQIANHADAIYMPLNEQNDFKPKLLESDLKKVSMVILNSPNNPTGQILNREELMEWAKFALEYDFILVNDECYSEIYKDDAPPSLLEACKAIGNTSFKNSFVINSISKRLSAPGLRSGFIAGDSNILKDYKVFRTYVGISMPLTLQKASIIAWQEDEYAQSIRKKFAKNLEIAQEIFPHTRVYPYTFYLWLCVANTKHKIPKDFTSDMLFTQELYKRSGHKVLPGSFLGREKSGMGYVRIALTHEEEVMRKALLGIKECYEDFIKRD